MSVLGFGERFLPVAPSVAEATASLVASIEQTLPGESTLIVSRHPYPRTSAGSDRLWRLGRAGQGQTTPERPVFLDIETTGLGGGAGTLVFLVGLAYADSDDVVVEQYFLGDPAAEWTLLSAVTRRLEGFDALVTFNGKSFDLPILAGRLAFHRHREPAVVAHLDLLHPARRIWSRRLRQSNLGTLESRVLGVSRDADVPGYEVPARYFAYLRERQISAIAPVLAHNRQDLLSLMQLASHLDRLLADDGAETVGSAPDLLGLGTLHEADGRRELARTCYEAALLEATPRERAEALHRLAGLAQRANEIERAIELLMAVAEASRERGADASISLAKLFEHHAREPVRALTYARRALVLLQAQPQLLAHPDTAAVARRISRLEKKVARSTS